MKPAFSIKYAATGRARALSLPLLWSAQLALVGLCALALKSYYSSATADDLRWILAPTTALVALFSGQHFEFESYAGYMSSDHRFVIAVPCAGVNFLITAFLMVTLRRLWRERYRAIRWRFIPLAGLLAYVATIITNTTRIWLALELRERSVGISGLTNNQLHRLEGIVVYFGFLLLLFLLLERFETATPLRLTRFLPFPLAIYYATTLGIPLLNGAFRQRSAFVEHSVFVLVLPLLLLAPLALFVRMQKPYGPHLPRLLALFNRIRAGVVRAVAALHAATTAADGNRAKHIF